MSDKDRESTVHRKWSADAQLCLAETNLTQFVHVSVYVYV